MNTKHKELLTILRKIHLLLFFIIMVVLSACGNLFTQLPTGTSSSTVDDYDYELIFPSERYPETALHIYGLLLRDIPMLVQSIGMVLIRIARNPCQVLIQKMDTIGMNGQWPCVKKAEKEQV